MQKKNRQYHWLIILSVLFFVLNYIAAATISPRSVISPGSLNLTLQYPKDPQTAV